jgi:hypothetical protein
MTGEHPYWNGEQAAAWLRNQVEKGQLAPCRALVLSAAMADEAGTLSQLGFHTIVVDRSKQALAQAKSQARGQGAGLDTIEGDFFTIRPGYYGPVELVYDRTFIHDQDPLQRAAWAHHAGRVLPKGGCLQVVFLVGRSIDGPPYPITVPDLQKLLQRLFIIEHFEPLGSAGPGKEQAYKGVFRRK